MAEQRTLEEIAKELNHVLNLNGAVDSGISIGIKAGKIEATYRNAVKKSYTAQQAEDLINFMYEHFSLKRE